jgi:hypothetical protein
MLATCPTDIILLILIAQYEMLNVRVCAKIFILSTERKQEERNP